jgi:hypothetical protein
MSFNFDSLTNSQEYKAHSCLYVGSSGTFGATCDSNDSIVTKSLSDIMNKYRDLSNNTGPAGRYAATDLVNAYKLLQKKMTRFDDTAGTSPYANSYTKLKDEIETKRMHLDTKLESIYNTKGSIANEYKSHYESTIMSGVLWGTLAVTMIYYVFYKSD